MHTTWGLINLLMKLTNSVPLNIPDIVITQVWIIFKVKGVLMQLGRFALTLDRTEKTTKEPFFLPGPAAPASANAPFCER